MSVGTKKIKIARIKNNQLKLSNLKSENIAEKKTNIFLNLLKAVAIGVVISVLAAAGQGWLGSVLAGFGYSEVVVQTTASLVGAALEFGLMTGYDAIEGNVNSTNIILNLLVFQKVIKAYTRSAKMSKVLIQADELGIFKKLGINSSEIKNFYQLMNKLNGKKFTIDRIIYDFTQGAKSNDILQLFSSINSKKSISLISKTSKSSKGFLAKNIDDLVAFQELLMKINPKLFPKVSEKSFKNASWFLTRNKLKPKDLLDNKVFSWVITHAETPSRNVSGNMIWAFYSLKMTKEIDSKISNSLIRILKKGNEKLSYLDLEKTIGKLINQSLNKLLGPLKKPINSLKKMTLKKVDPIFKKINLPILKKAAKITYQNIDKLLMIIPNSDWLLAYRVKPLANTTYMVEIYFKSPKYYPRIFYFSLKELKDWIKACENSRAGEFYKANLELGYHLKHSSFLALLSVLPPVILQFIKEGIKIYKTINSVRNEIKGYKNIDQRLRIKIEKSTVNFLENYALSIAFSSVFFRKTFKNWIHKKSNRQHIEQFLIKKSRNKIYKKIPSI